MKILNLYMLCVFLALAWCADAAAQTADDEDLALVYGDKSTVSIATGIQQPISRAPAVASVITARDIKAMGATDLDQALESVPGLHVSMLNIGLKPIYSFRGIFTGFNAEVLMLVNGIPITSAYQGDRGVVWGGMPLENVQRIEVIRGPGSALYGADAFAGVINVITKTAADINGTKYGLRAGSFNSRDAWIQHGGKLGVFDAAFYLGAGKTDGQKNIIENDAQSAWDTCFTSGCSPYVSAIPGYVPVSLAPGPIDAERKSIEASADLSHESWRFRTAYQKSEVGTGTGLAGSLDPYGRGQSSKLNLDMRYEKANWAPNWDLSGILSYFSIKEYGDPFFTLFPAGAFGGAFPNGMIGNPGHAERNSNASVSALYTGFKRHQVRMGTGYRIEDIYETSEVKNFTYAPGLTPIPLQDVTGNPALIYMLPHKRNLSYLFAQDEWNFAKDWTLTAGVRHDHYSDFGGTTNPRLALVWDAAYNIVVKAMHGTAFRAPSFAELYSINNPVVFGNANLKPETITTDELAFSWKPVTKLQTNLNFFRYRMRDIILSSPLDPQFHNAGDQVGRGLELESTLDATDNLRLTGNFSLQHSIDQTTGQDAGMAPHRRLFILADWRFAPLWQVGTKANYVADRMRQPGDTRPKIPDYTLVDLILRRDGFSGDWDVRAMVTNLFNRDALEPTFQSVGATVPGNPITLSDLPLPGRAFYLQFQHKL